MVAVRLARGWIGYGGAVHRPGDLVDVDAITLAKLEASGVVTPTEDTDPEAAYRVSEPSGRRHLD